jgi:peptidoglycan/LPS O-acetylase OafA/YrhL
MEPKFGASNQPLPRDGADAGFNQGTHHTLRTSAHSFADGSRALLLSASLSWEHWFPTWRVPGAAMIAMISYSLYLSHKMTTHAVQSLLSPESLTGSQGLVIYYASSIAGGAVLWWLIERPFLRLRDRLLLKRQICVRTHM